MFAVPVLGLRQPVPHEFAETVIGTPDSGGCG